MIAALKANMKSGERTDLGRAQSRLSLKEAADEVGVRKTVAEIAWQKKTHWLQSISYRPTREVNRQWVLPHHARAK